MKRMKKVLKIGGPVVLILGVLAVMASFKSQDELSAEEKEQIAAFTANANSNSAGTASTIQIEDAVTSALNAEEEDTDGNPAELNNNEDRIVVTPITPSNRSNVIPTIPPTSETDTLETDTTETDTLETDTTETDTTETDTTETDTLETDTLETDTTETDTTKEETLADNGDGNNGDMDSYKKIQ